MAKERVPTVTLMTGLPASGKTTRALELVAKGARRVSLDDLHEMLDGTGRRLTPRRKDDLIALQRRVIYRLVRDGYDVVVDNDHLTEEIPRGIRRYVGANAHYEVIDLTDVSLDECIARDAARAASGERSVGAKSIRRAAKKLADERLRGYKLNAKSLNHAAQAQAYVTPEPYTRTDLPEVVICDIDGTVALNDGHRGHHDYDKVIDDKPKAKVIELVQLLATQFPIVFISGRQDGCRSETELWLKEHVGVDFELYMRKEGDKRPDYVVKSEIFDEHLRDHVSIHLVLEDRDQVVRLWRDIGLTCLQVDYGDF